MVKQIHIENYKSVQSLDIELGRLNVFIGANGCGKTNILEAIALGSAAAADKLDHEFLGSRGIRVTEPIAMKAGFSTYNSKPIEIRLSDIQNRNLQFILDYEKRTHDWKIIDQAPFSNKNQEIISEITKKINEFNQKDKAAKDVIVEDYDIAKIVNSIMKLNSAKKKIGMNNFLIFAPENYFLRRFEEEAQIKPLGIRGEGLFSHLVELTKKPDVFNNIKEHLQLIDWFDDFAQTPSDLDSALGKRKILINDRFIAEGLRYFDQRSANEGFLYLLFYVTLFISPYTPKFFAIDNIDNSLNPKLCSELTKMLAQLAKKEEHNKQVILTTHNPAVLDGLNLNDDEQRLFVIYRNADGHTKAERIFKKEMPNGMSPVKLSEQFLRGYLGGLNENF